MFDASFDVFPFFFFNIILLFSPLPVGEKKHVAALNIENVKKKK